MLELDVVLELDALVARGAALDVVDRAALGAGAALDVDRAALGAGAALDVVDRAALGGVRLVLEELGRVVGACTVIDGRAGVGRSIVCAGRAAYVVPSARRGAE